MATKREVNFEQICQTVQQRQLPGLALFDSYFTEEVAVPVHSHDQVHVTLVLSGDCEETYLGKTRMLMPPTVTYFHPGETHTLHTISRRFRTFDIELDRDWLNRFLEHPIAASALLDGQNHSVIWLATRLYKEFKDADDLSPLAMEGLALEMLAELARAAKRVSTKKAPRWLGRVVERIHDEFAKPISLANLAEVADVHPSHLAQVFREHFHCSPGEFIRQVRIEQAMRRMTDSEASLADISLATGFSDQSHFSRLFKRTTGLTPAQFRQLHLGAKFVQTTRQSFKTNSSSRS